MTDELLLTLADMADVSPKKVRMIVDAYEKATTVVKPVPEGYTVFEYEGKRYAYKSLGDGPWTLECASVALMKVLRNYFIRSGKMEKWGNWPGSSYGGAWTSDVDSYGHHVGLGSSGTHHYYYDSYNARFAVLPL